MYSNATPSPVVVVLQGTKVAAQEHPWSIIVRMASCPLAFSSWVMRSSVMTLNGHMEGSLGIWYNGVFFFVVHTLLCRQWEHSATSFHPCIHSGPPVVLGNQSDGVISFWVAHCG